MASEQDIHLQQGSEQYIARILNRLHTKYTAILQYYYARNLRCFTRTKSKNHESILFNDYLYYDCDDDFLKRFYKEHETTDRIKLLVAYFQRNRVMSSQTPFILPEGARKLLDKRIKRRLKTNRKVKELDQADPFQGAGQFIFEISGSQLDASSSNNDHKVHVSYQSKLYDIYTNSITSQTSVQTLGGAQSVTLTSLMALPIEPQDTETKRFSEEQVEHLICNFNDRDVERIVKQYTELSLKQPEIKLQATGQLPEPHKLNLKLNLEKLDRNKNLDEMRIKKPTHQQFYEQAKKKQEERKVYYVKGAQKNYQLTSRSPQNRQYESSQRLHTLGNEQLTDRMVIRRYSPETLRPEQMLYMYRETDRFPLGKLTDRKEISRLPSNRNTDRQYLPSNINTDRQYYCQPVILTDRTGDRENYYKRILDRLRQNKKLQSLGRLSAQARADKQEKDRRLEQLKEKAVELLYNSKQQGRFYDGSKTNRNTYLRK